MALNAYGGSERATTAIAGRVLVATGFIGGGKGSTSVKVMFTFLSYISLNIRDHVLHPHKMISQLPFIYGVALSFFTDLC